MRSPLTRVYKIARAGCNTCYVGETVRQFSTRVRGHLARKRAFSQKKGLSNLEICALCSADCLYVLDHASTSFNLKIAGLFIFRGNNLL